MANEPGILAPHLRRLERALSRETAGCEHTWARQVNEALTSLLPALRRHAADADEQMIEVDQTRPTLARQVTELQAEHGQLLDRAIRLCRQVRDAQRAFQPPSQLAIALAPAPRPAIPDFGLLRQHARDLLSELRRHETRETDLVLESVTTDIGVGD